MRANTLRPGALMARIAGAFLGAGAVPSIGQILPSLGSAYVPNGPRKTHRESTRTDLLGRKMPRGFSGAKLMRKALLGQVSKGQPR